MLTFLDDAWTTLTGWLFLHAVQPVFYAAGLMDWADDAFEWMDFFLFGLFSVAVVYVVCRPLEAWRPVEHWGDRSAVGTDVLYTLLARLGLLPMLAFILLASLQARLEGAITDTGWIVPSLESLAPWLRDQPFVAFAVYVVVLDFGEYWRHRFQHRIGWWWALHSLHHAQTQMTFWTDDRNHILDDCIAALWFGGLALLIGVPPGQFPLVVLVLRLAESLSHANVRLSFGAIGERMVVSPRFHRLHHGLLSAGDAGKNYGVLLPVWDWIFGTADFRRDQFPLTGDPDATPVMAHGGWLRQQGEGFRRLWSSLRGRMV